MGRTRDVVKQVRWYVSSLMGDNHYRRYVEHRRRAHPGEPVVTEAEYWRMRHRKSETDPTARCC